MAIPGQQTINIGQPNDPANSDSLYTAFNTIQNNFTELFTSAGEIQTLVAGNGINISNSSASSYVITNTGVTTLVAGENVTITTLGGSPAGNGTLVINSTGTGNGGGGSVNSVGVTSNTLSVINSPVISSGNIVVDLPTISGVSGSYSSANIVVDSFGRITSATNGSGSGTVTSVSVSVGSGLSVSGSPITTSGTINMINTGVTSIVAGSGVSINQSTGAVTISSTGGGGNGGGTVTRVGLLSNSLTVTGSPIITSGNLTVDLPSNISVNQITANIGNISNVNIQQLQLNSSNSNVGMILTTSSNDSDQFGIQSRKSRGTISSPTAIQTGDLLLNLQSMGYTSYNKYQLGGSLQVLAEGAPTSGTSRISTSVKITSSDSEDIVYDLILDKGGNLIIPGRISQRTYSNVASRNSLSVVRSRGTDIGNVLAVQVGDTIARESYYGYTGNGIVTVDSIPGWSYAGTTESVVTGLPGSSGAYIPSAYYIRTVSTSNSINTFTFAGSGNLNVPDYVTANNANLGNLVIANYFAGTLTTAAQPNITSVGTLTSLTVTNNIISGNVYANSGTIGASLLTGTLTTAAQPNITSVGTLASLSVTNNITSGNVYANSGNIRGTTLTAVGNVNSGNASLGNLATANYFTGTLTTNAQPNVTSVGTLTSLDVTGNISAGNVNISGNIVSNAVGTPTFVSTTSITLQAVTVVDITGGAVLRLPKLTTAQIALVTAVNGDMVYDTDLNKFQGYENGAWANLI